jgi:hypothetical protein
MMLGSSCSQCCLYCGCDIPPSQVLMTSPSRAVLDDLVGAFATTGNPQDFNYQLKQAVGNLAFRSGQMACVAVRDDSVAPYGGYGFSYADTTPDLSTAFSIGFFGGGGAFLPGGFQQGSVSQPGLIATLNVIRISFAATLFGYFIEQNPSHPQADRNGKPYCMKFGGSMSETFAIWDVANNYTPQTAPDYATLVFTIADANLGGGGSYPALYKSSAPIGFAFGQGVAADRRMFPAPYICMPNNSFSVGASLSMRQYSSSFTNQVLTIFTNPGRIDLEFAGDGIRSGSSANYAVGP